MIVINNFFVFVVHIRLKVNAIRMFFFSLPFVCTCSESNSRPSESILTPNLKDIFERDKQVTGSAKKMMVLLRSEIDMVFIALCIEVFYREKGYDSEACVYDLHNWV